MNPADRYSKCSQDIVNRCTSCNNCISECHLLKKIGEDPISIAKRNPTVDEAFSCSFCGLCEAVCPKALSLGNIFAETRRAAVANNYVAINEYRYMFPDRKNNVTRFYREINGIAYDDLCSKQEASAAFFPGCTMVTYSPELTRALFNQLNSEYEDLTLITDCCGIILYQLGLQTRGEEFTDYLKAKLIRLKVKTLVTACPDCYYQLRPILEDLNIELLTIYEALDRSDFYSNALKDKSIKTVTVTVHDSCPDRFEGIFANQVRKALVQKGFVLVEMEHNRKTTVCCGSGGQVSHFQPDLAEKITNKRLHEANMSKAQILSAYCLGCVLNFAKTQGKQKVQHVLNLLLNLEQDYTGIKIKAKGLFAGPKGEENWARIMAE